MLYFAEGYSRHADDPNTTVFGSDNSFGDKAGNFVHDRQKEKYLSFITSEKSDKILFGRTGKRRTGHGEDDGTSGGWRPPEG
jgi:hypothetical protein